MVSPWIIVVGCCPANRKRGNVPPGRLRPFRLSSRPDRLFVSVPHACERARTRPSPSARVEYTTFRRGGRAYSKHRFLSSSVPARRRRPGVVRDHARSGHRGNVLQRRRGNAVRRRGLWRPGAHTQRPQASVRRTDGDRRSRLGPGSQCFGPNTGSPGRFERFPPPPPPKRNRVKFRVNSR